MSFLTTLADIIKDRIGNLKPKDMPFGSIVYRNIYNIRLTDETIIKDWDELYDNYFGLASSNLRFTSDKNTLLYGTTGSKIREALSYNGTNWQSYAGYANFAEVSATGSSFTSIEPYKFNFNTNVISTNYFCDFDNSKVIIGILVDLNSYCYSEDMTTFTKVNTPFNLSYPCISGNVYSFMDGDTNQRKYTTDHITFSNCSDFGSSNIPVLKMSNGYLYTVLSTTLRISTNDGITWTSYTLPVAASSLFKHSIDYDGTTYVFGSNSNALYSSTDLITWDARTSNISGSTSLQRVFYVNGTFFVFSNTTSTTSFSTSTDGITWTNRTSPNSIICSNVIYVNSLYMILGTNRVLTSSDLATWTSSLGAGNSDDDSQTRSFYGTGTKASFINNNIWYFYNAGSWTTITASQGLSNVEKILFSTNSTQFIKVS